LTGSQFKLAFTVETMNPWGIAMKHGNDELQKKIDTALEKIILNSLHQKIWDRNFKIIYPKIFNN
jgi:ABC-type amino acid transport substrate-binding protein